jgi:Tfp pilus assembly protein FimT
MTMLNHMRKNVRNFGKFRDHGFSVVELLVVVFIVIVIAGIGIPKLVTLLTNLRTYGDARDLNGEVVQAKMRAASDFARARLYADLSANTFHIDVYQSGASGWTTEGGTQYLSSGVTFGYGSLTTPPTGVTTLTQAPLCLQDNLTSTVANTACIMFNSRGIPVDSTWAPTGNDALYVTDGKSVTGVTVSATGLTKVWRSDASAANWNQN